MLFRRVSKHVKEQNWFAVAIDFFIVVVGVFIGIQVANWNETTTDQRQLEARLVAFSVELQTNIKTIETFRDIAVGQIASIIQLRVIFSEEINAEKDVVAMASVDRRLASIMGIYTLRPELVAYEELANSGNLTVLTGTSLRRHVSDWEADLGTLNQIDQNRLSHRDGFILPYFIEHTSFAAMVDSSGFEDLENFASSRFRNNIEILAGSREIENMLALRFISETESIEAADNLLASSLALIDALEDPESRK